MGTKKKRAVKKAAKKKAVKTLLNLKVSAEDRKIFQLNADKYARGNISAWMRYAGRVKPRRKTSILPPLKKAA